MSLDCPAPGNLAAIAKQLHETAQEAEDQISASEQKMRAAVNRPTVVLTSTANLTGLTNGFQNDVGLGATWATTFDNTSGGGGSGTGSFGPQNFGGFTTALGEGLYEVGFCATAVASGVVNDNTNRQFLIQHLRPDPTAVTGETEIQTVGILVFESNTGVGSEVSIVGEFRAREGDRFAFLFSHDNTGSTMIINAGAIIWANKVSNSDLTQVI